MDAVYRWSALATVVGVMGVSAYYRHRARRATGTIPRGREQPGLIVARLLVAVPLFGSVVAYLVRPSWMTWSAIPLPAVLRLGGIILGVTAIPAAWWVFSSIGHNVSETVLTKEQHELVTHGPYRWVRHPLYALGIAVFTALGLMAANGFILGMAGLALWGILGVIVPREERGLIEKFGDDYRRYAERTGRLLPRLGR